MPGEWIRRPQGDASAVFVHGIRSSGETCWRNANGSYWPELLRNEPELAQLGIYVFTYQTDIFSGSYRLLDIMDALNEFMERHRLLECNRLIFVCHSMGGIVVRKFIVSHAVNLNETKKEIMLFLVASPSLGSEYADFFRRIAEFLGHAQAQTLQVVSNNSWLQDLDREFINLKDGGKPKITGKELYEDKPIPPMKKVIVEEWSAARYFAHSLKVPGSDHSSIAKPKDKTAIQHRSLCRFILKNALSSDRPAPTPPHINHGEVPSKPPTPAPSVPTDISRIIKYAPAQLIGREAETQLLYDAWAKAQNNETMPAWNY
jgi:Putative serine esterase (DUF676)